MTFNINQLDKVEYDGSDKSEEALGIYQDSVLEEFAHSSEGRERIEADPEMGFWIAQLIDYGFSYIGVTLPQMDKCDVTEIVTDLFPAKISLSSPEDAEDAIPELLAFWQFLKSKYKLRNADKILEFLAEIEPEFTAIMNDPSNFGMAKSFMTMGQKAGFDMADQNQMKDFIKIYNENVITGQSNIPSTKTALDFVPESSQSKKTNKKKQKRKIAKSSRKKNKKKRKR